MTEYIILIPLGVMIFELLPAVWRDSYLDRFQKHTMLEITGLIFLLVVQNVSDYILQTAVSAPYIRTLESILGYIIRPVIIVLFCKLVKPKVKNTFAWILVAANAAVYLTATFSHFAFYIDEDNRFQGGVFYFSKTAFVVSFVLLFYLIYCTVTEYKNKKTWIWIPIVNTFLIIASALLDISPAFRVYPVSYLTISVVCCSLFYYIWLHLEFVKEHENALKAEQRIKIMMSQIQPHFLYNTLSTIQALCVTDPDKAASVTEQFGTYLRRNLDSLYDTGLIPLSKELEHTEVYVGIEMLRFPKITVDYDIQTEDFALPALTIQPLVENAIRHGVRSREHGLVSVATREDSATYKIIISDNGIGFDVGSIDNTDGEHIGIVNVKERIGTMCKGMLDIDSRIDEGTTITISIPKEERK